MIHAYENSGRCELLQMAGLWPGCVRRQWPQWPVRAGASLAGLRESLLLRVTARFGKSDAPGPALSASSWSSPCFQHISLLMECSRLPAQTHDGVRGWERPSGTWPPVCACVGILLIKLYSFMAERWQCQATRKKQPPISHVCP